MSGAPFSPLASGRFDYDTGTAGTVTVTKGSVWAVSAHATNAGATLTITPGGANQTGVAGGAIPIPAGVAFSLPLDTALGNGSVLAFSGTDSYFVHYVKSITGA